MSFLSLFVSVALAAQIVVNNKTGADIRIAKFKNKCGAVLVSEDKPVFIKDQESVVFKDVTPVIHTYEICGSGYCSSSAIGFSEDGIYVIDVTLDGPYINPTNKPEIWPGNMECK